MDYVVYCDRSYPHGSEHSYMAIGSLWVPRADKPSLTRDFRFLCQSLELNAPIKWRKVSDKYWNSYQKLVDFFRERDNLQFRVMGIDVNQNNKNSEKHLELGFYKFYDRHLIKGMTPGNKYLILLDFQNQKNLADCKALRGLLEQSLSSRAAIADLTIIDSNQSPLAQLCDLLTGGVAASWSGTIGSTPKTRLAAYIAENSIAPSVLGEKLIVGRFNLDTNSVALGV